MARPTRRSEMNENTRTRRTVSFRIDDNFDALDAWTRTAGDEDVNAVYAVLFAVADGTVERDYPVVDDPKRLSEFSVLVHTELVVKIRVNSFDSFGVVAVGPQA
jgi:hypothetical protein